MASEQAGLPGCIHTSMASGQAGLPAVYFESFLNAVIAGGGTKGVGINYIAKKSFSSNYKAFITSFQSFDE